ncbi:MAG: RNHCP domain-containing protein [Candidatus Andersenbacteria bacterium]
MDRRTNFIPRNEGFVCEQCQASVPPASGTFRNHCPECLASKHVDRDVPGDRLNPCQGLMPAAGVEGTDPDSLDIIHCCKVCGYQKRNRIAPDDNREQIFAIMDTRV